MLYNREFFEREKIIGKDSIHVENGKLRGMVNFTRLAMLHHGAIQQVGDVAISARDSIEELRATLDQQNSQLLALQSQLAQLEKGRN